MEEHGHETAEDVNGRVGPRGAEAHQQPDAVAAQQLALLGRQRVLQDQQGGLVVVGEAGGDEAGPRVQQAAARAQLHAPPLRLLQQTETKGKAEQASSRPPSFLSSPLLSVANYSTSHATLKCMFPNKIYSLQSL